MVRVKPDQNGNENQNELKVFTVHDTDRDRSQKVSNIPANLLSVNGLETLCNVAKEVSNVGVRQLPDTGLPGSKDHFNRVALGGGRGVEEDLAPVCLSKFRNFTSVNGGVVHHQHQVLVFKAAQFDKLSHTRLENVRVDGRVEDLAMSVTSLCDHTNTAE